MSKFQLVITNFLLLTISIPFSSFSPFRPFSPLRRAEMGGGQGRVEAKSTAQHGYVGVEVLKDKPTAQHGDEDVGVGGGVDLCCFLFCLFCSFFIDLS